MKQWMLIFPRKVTLWKNHLWERKEEASPNLNSITQDEEATTPSSTPVEYNKENEITDDLNPIGRT